MEHGVVVCGVVTCLVLALPGCDDTSCMDDRYSRRAAGSADYSGPDDKNGSLPVALVMRRYRPFRDGLCSLDDGSTFEIEVSPTCRLNADVTSREYDTGRNSSQNFLQAEAFVGPSGVCTLELGGHRVSGTVQSGTVAIHPRTIALAFGLYVTEWDGVAIGAPGSTFFRYRTDASWR